jgi:uracil-DNA glycosylase family 4
MRPAPLRPAAIPTFATRAELGQHAGNCSRCILSKDRERVVWSGGVENSTWMVLTLFGWGEDVASGELLSASYAQTFRDLARSVGLPEPVVGAVFCCPPRNPADTSVQGRIEATRCRPYWSQLLRLSGAKAVLVLDHKAAQLAAGKALEWPAFRGQPFTLEGLPAIATHHPARLARQAALAPEVEADLRQILSFPGVSP